MDLQSLERVRTKSSHPGALAVTQTELLFLVLTEEGETDTILSDVLQVTVAEKCVCTCKK